MLILEEVPKRYLSLWIDFLKDKFNTAIKKTDNKDMLTPELLIAWEFSIVASPTFITDFLSFSIEWFKAHDDKCEECGGKGDFRNTRPKKTDKKNILYGNTIIEYIPCPACQGTGKKWWKELKIIGG